jgi:folate-binding protein YgfZ
MPELTPAHFGDPQREYQTARLGCALFDRSHMGRIAVEGRDARSFLNNLSTNDVRNLPPGAVCEAFFCTANAKVVAYVRLECLTGSGPGSGGFFLETAPGANRKVLDHLNHYLISEDVELADRTDLFAQLYLVGPTAAEVLTRALGGREVPAERRQAPGAIGGVGVDVWRFDLLGVPGFDLIVGAGQAGEVRQALLGLGASPAGREAYEVLRVEAGTPAAGVDVDETTFAFEVGRTEQAVSYTKGCYLGQEPIVMARDRGQANRRLVGLKLAEPAPHNSTVWRDGKEVGRVTSSVVSPRLGTALALAYLRRGSWEPGTAVEVETGGRRLPAEAAGLPF